MDCREIPPGVLRDDLLQLLCRCEHYPLTLLLAPAGSGKSTLLSHWRAHYSSRALAYYPLQARDNHALRFFRRLIESIRAQVSDFDLSWFNPLEASLSPEVVGEYLAEALERIDGGLCLVETQVAPNLSGPLDYGHHTFVKPMMGSFALVDETDETHGPETSTTGICLVPSVEGLLWILRKVGFAHAEVLPVPADGYEQLRYGKRVMVAARR